MGLHALPLGFTGLVNTPACGLSRYRKKFGLYSFKLGRNSVHKNPHGIDRHAKQMFKKQGYQGQLKINERNRLSERPFGKLNQKAKFKFEVEKVPFYNVPDLTDFKLKAYVPHMTPPVPEEMKVYRLVSLDKSAIKNIEKQIDAAHKGGLMHKDE